MTLRAVSVGQNYSNHLDERFRKYTQNVLPKGFQETEANVHKLKRHHPGRVLHKNGLRPFCAAVSRFGKQSFVMTRQYVLDGYAQYFAL